MLQEKGTKII